MEAQLCLKCLNDLSPARTKTKSKGEKRNKRRQGNEAPPSVVNSPYLAPLSPPFFSLLYGLRLVQTAAIKTNYELFSFFSFIPTLSVSPKMTNWPAVLLFLLPFIDSFTLSPPAAANPFLPSRPWSAGV